MFPRLREQIGTALDLFVEFSTLGEYRLDVDGIGASSAPAEAPGQAPQLGGVGAGAPRAAVRRTTAGGATGTVPVATPAARRSLAAGEGPALRQPAGGSGPGACGTRRHASEAAGHAPARSRARKGAPKAPEQLCLAV